MADLSPPGAEDASTVLPEGHLALVVEDALREVDEASAHRPDWPPTPDLRAAIIYGWAVGAISARALATRAGEDPGLTFLLDGKTQNADDSRALRERNAALFAADVGDALYLLALAGVQRLGRIRIPSPSDHAMDRFGRLTRDLLDASASADVAEDLAIDASTDQDDLPPSIASRAARQEAFRSTRARRGAEEPRGEHEAAVGTGIGVSDTATETAFSPATSRPHHRRSRTPLDVLAAVATLALVFGGLVLIRWLSTTYALAPTEGRTVTVAAVPPVGSPVPAQPTQPTAGGFLEDGATQEELMEARDEALRLAKDALDDNDLQAAHDFYFLAVQAVPEDVEAADHLRQVDVALGISSRRGDWDTAVADLSDLRVVAPSSSVVLQAYVTALVAAGRQALADGDRERAIDLCGEALRWFPTRADARACNVAGGGGSPTPTPPATTTPRATPTEQRPTAIAVTPVILVPPTPPSDLTALPSTGAPTVAPLENLAVVLSVSCQSGSSGPNGGPSLRISGTISSPGGPVSNYHLLAAATSPGGAVTSLANTTNASPLFQLQQQVGSPGTYVVTVIADKDGYTSAETSRQVSC